MIFVVIGHYTNVKYFRFSQFDSKTCATCVLNLWFSQAVMAGYVFIALKCLPGYTHKKEVFTMLLRVGDCLRAGKTFTSYSETNSIGAT